MIPAYPTQAWDIPQNAYSDEVQIAVPPNQFLPRVGYPLPHDPTQAWVQWPQQDDRVRIVVPENQIKAGAVTGNPRVQAQVPAIQSTFGPFPNDRMAVPTVNYLPYRKGWIHSDQGDIFTLQGSTKMSNANPNMMTVRPYAITRTGVIEPYDVTDQSPVARARATIDPYYRAFPTLGAEQDAAAAKIWFTFGAALAGGLLVGFLAAKFAGD